MYYPLPCAFVDRWAELAVRSINVSRKHPEISWWYSMAAFGRAIDRIGFEVALRPSGYKSVRISRKRIPPPRDNDAWWMKTAEVLFAAAA